VVLEQRYAAAKAHIIAGWLIIAGVAATMAGSVEENLPVGLTIGEPFV
jgi:hypothetical protein